MVTHQSFIKILIYDALKRTFGPDEPPLLKDYFLHDLIWDKTLQIQRINRLGLNPEDKIS